MYSIYWSNNILIFARYLRLPVEETGGLIADSSEDRMDTFCKFAVPKTKDDIIQMLGDQTGKRHQVFRENGGEEFIKTIAVGNIERHKRRCSFFDNFFSFFSTNFAGIFDCRNYTWELYADNPKTHKPIAVLPIVLKETNKN